MKAIIIPLNEYFYNFKKYDGRTPPQRFIETRPLLYKFFRSRAGEKIFLAFLYPFAFILFCIIFGPIYIYDCLRGGKKQANNKANKILDRMNKWTDKMTRKDMKKFLQKFTNENFKLFLYYSDEMIPKNEKQRDLFFIRLEKMKEGLNLHHVFLANEQADVEEVMQLYGIDPDQSFFMSDGKIDLGNMKMIE